MTDDQFRAWATKQLSAYVETEAFRARCASIVERQRQGEDFDLAGIAQILGVPLWLCELGLHRAADLVRAQLTLPETGVH